MNSPKATPIPDKMVVQHYLYKKQDVQENKKLYNIVYFPDGFDIKVDRL